jgi:CRP/FNR family transcriptional regulator, anaerobic regulatory protein
MIPPEDMTFITNNFSFYEYLNDDEKKIFERGVLRTIYTQGTLLQHTSASCLGAILIKTGTLRVYLLSEDGREVTLYRLHNEDVCMLSASCILPVSIDVHISAESDTSCYVIPTDIFAHLTEKNIHAANFSYKATITRFSDVMHAIELLFFTGIDKRLAHFLLNESSHSTTDVITITHDQIARYIGSAREVVSRALKTFQEQHIISQSRGKITITDRQKLSTI